MSSFGFFLPGEPRGSVSALNRDWGVQRELATALQMTNLIQTGSTTTDKHISVRRGENLSQEENDVSKPKQRKPGSGSVRKDLHAFRHVLDRLLAPPCMKSIINSFLMGPIGDTAPERYQ